jgi:hypothetical protein
MNKRPTLQAICESFILWGEYIDPIGLDTLEAFESMTYQDRMDIAEGMFGIFPEANE